ncbi:MAG: Gfo/Idh/MocA family oxidoreductase [Deferribacteraceae bacterium]|nr:Gfo/Idh/MocA family oxidoreductase [Deferribacteraceae bacterium]
MGLIGLGKMGGYHLNLYDEIPEIKLTALCDADEGALGLQVIKKNVPGFTNYRNILPLVDAVTIAAPTKLHYEITRACLEAGKHIFVEKPITTDYRQAAELFELAEKKHLTIQIGYVERFNGVTRELKNIVSNPTLIEARRVGPFNPNFKNDSIIMDIMIHDIDIALSVSGRQVAAIQAMGAPVHTKLADYASVNIYFGNSSMAHIVAGRINHVKERFINITQDDTLIMLDYLKQNIDIIRKGQLQDFSERDEIKYKNNPLKNEIEHFVSCVEGKSARIVSIEHDLHTMEVALEVDSLLKSNTYGYKEF